MLGSLAKWLRILGFDTFYANNELTDDDLLHIATIENRTVISRDKELTSKGKKQGLKVIEIRNTDLDQQLNQVLDVVNIDENLVLSRCSLCNTPLKKFKKSEVEGKVPQKVFDHHDKFWYCSKCKKFYWMGSHYEKITDKIKEITHN
ncbi:MAG: Mut7-C RNAse domain-containing protein [Petrotogales bacterium]